MIFWDYLQRKRGKNASLSISSPLKIYYIQIMGVINPRETCSFVCRIRWKKSHHYSITVSHAGTRLTSHSVVDFETLRLFLVWTHHWFAEDTSSTVPAPFFLSFFPFLLLFSPSTKIRLTIVISSFFSFQYTFANSP